MKDELKINLTEKESQYHRITYFPDGQHDVWISPEVTYYKRIVIQSHFNSWQDLEIIACAKASIKELGCNNIELFIPYFLGARSDRKFEEGGNWYLKDVAAPAINNLKFRKVTIVDPHS